MKSLIPISFSAIALIACGCQNPKPVAENPPLRSERQYAETTEARAQNLFKTGQASSLPEARAKAAGEINQEWAAAAKAAEQKAKQEKFEKDLAQSERERK